MTGTAGWMPRLYGSWKEAEKIATVTGVTDLNTFRTMTASAAPCAVVARGPELPCYTCDTFMVGV